MHSHARKHQRMTDYHMPLADQRRAEDQRQKRKLLLSIVPCVIVAIVLIVRRFL